MAEDDEPEKCVIWGTSAKYEGSTGGYVDLWSARAGGSYRVTTTAKVTLEKSPLPVPQRVLLTSLLVNKRESETGRPVISSDTLGGLEREKRIRVTDRVDRMLLWLNGHVPGLGRHLPIATFMQGYARNDLALEYIQLLGADIGSSDEHETLEVLNFARKSGFIEYEPKAGDSGGYASLSFKGYQRVEFLETQKPLGEQAFVAMWFHAETNDAYENGIKLGIEDSGYKPVRIDRIDHNNKIDDEIIAEIRRSKFIVADFTSEVISKNRLDGSDYREAIARGGVYFEAGFAKGLGREVIWTVSEDVLPLVHFDTRQFAHIVWKDAADLRSKLAKRISATMGDGPLKKPN